MNERDKFLTEYLGECWHEIYRPLDLSKPLCKKCGTQLYLDLRDNNNFSTWEGFGKLWEWCQKQEWWIPRDIWAGYTAYKDHGRYKIGDAFIHPDRFADVIYRFLKERI
jgi:hypothetical protein